MDKIWLVLKYDLRGIVLRRSFLLTLFLVPLVGFIVVLVTGSLQESAPKSEGNLVNEILPSGEDKVEGFVDHSGIIQSLVPGQEKLLRAFESEEQAQNALEAGDITGYYVVAQDYLHTGEVVFVQKKVASLLGFTQTGAIENILTFNLLGRDGSLFERFLVPVDQNKLKTEYLTNEPARDMANFATFIVPYVVTFIYYIIILSSSSMMLNSLASEKQNRVIELIVTSVKPTQMLAGKIIALGISGLLQTIVWVGGGYLLLKISGRSLDIPISLDLPPTFLIWAVVYFLLGYALYACLMAGVGALVPNLREASQAATVAILPMVIPLMFISALIEDPNGSLSVFLSLFPLTSPVTMMTRLSSGPVEFWHLGLSIVFLLVAIFLMVKVTARLFQTQNLLSGQSFNLKRWVTAIFGRG
jgi:ABC-2 type transport system permease protein